MKRRAAAPRRPQGDELVEPLAVVAGHRRAAVVDDEWRLVERELGERHAALGRLQREDGAGGDPVGARRAARFGDEGCEVLDLALDGVATAVAALPAPAAVVRERGEALGQHGRERLVWPGRAVGQRAVDEDDGGAAARRVNAMVVPSREVTVLMGAFCAPCDRRWVSGRRCA
jgi:hypothetical protein